MNSGSRCSRRSESGDLSMKKRILAALCAGLMLLTACAANRTAPQQKDMQQWLKTAKLDAEETPEELYAAALKEDTLVIYSISTRMMDVKKTFEERYPGLTVEVQDIRAGDLVEKLRDNYANRRYDCDIAVFTDSDAVISQDLVPGGLLYKYTPYDIAPKLYPENNTDKLEFLGEVIQIFYNDEVYDAPPVTNWWELTEPRFKNKVYIATPLRSFTTFAGLCTMVQHSDEMASAYKELYGEELDIPAGSSAGVEFLRRLFENGLQQVNSSDEVVMAVGTPGQTDPPMGIIISSKARERDIGYAVAPIFDVQPRAGTYVVTCAMLAGGAKNVNSAKLFIRWLLGEADGQGEGYKPYLQNGAWPTRSDVKSHSPMPLEEINIWRLDKDYLAENQDRIRKLWIDMQPK